MKKLVVLAGLIFVFLFYSPLVLAIDCSFISPSNYEYCLEILNSDIPEGEIELLISNLEYVNKFFPDHDYVYNINSNIEVELAPEGTTVYEKEFIKLGWVKIFSLMPSVLYGDILYVPEKTSIFTGFNYELKIPENYYGSKYSRNEYGDCKTKYYLLEDSSENKVYVNNKYAGSGKLLDVFVEADSEIGVFYNVDVEVKIKHYKWDNYCKYDYTEIKKESLKIEDDVYVKKYNNNLFAEVVSLPSYEETSRIKINNSDSIKVSFEDSKYSFNKFIYLINYSMSPYYVNTLSARSYNQEKLSNLFKDGDELIVKNAKDCKIFSYDFFNILEKDCDLEIQNLDFFIKTDKLKYNIGETIKVYIFPENISAKVSYANETRIARGYVEFLAVSYKNKILAEYVGIKSEKIIYIISRNRLLIIWNLFIFALFNYFFYFILKKYMRKII